MSTPFDKLFPQNLLNITKTVNKLKRKYDSSVPKLLHGHGYYKHDTHLYVNPFKNIILYYKQGDSKTKRPEIFNELVNHQLLLGIENLTRYELIYGFLSDKPDPLDETILLNDITIRIMSSESLLKHIFGDDVYNSIVENIGKEIKLMNLRFSSDEDLNARETSQINE